MSNWYTKPQGGWSFSVSNNSLFNTSGSTNSLHYAGENKTFFPNKTYLYRTKIRNLRSLTGSGIRIRTPWSMNFSNFSLTGITLSQTDGYINFYTNPTIRVDSSNNFDEFTNNNYSYVSYTDDTNRFGATHGILDLSIKELDWNLHGYSWIESVGLTSGTDLSNTNKGKGWSYNSYDNSEYYEFFGLSSGVGINPATSFTSSTIDNNFVEVNHLSRYVQFNFFNLYFTTTISGTGFEVFLSDDSPYKGTSTQSFYEWKNSADLIASYSTASVPSGVTFSAFFGLKGNRYVSFVSTQANSNKVVRLFDLRVEGGYSNVNNRQYSVSATSSNSNFETFGLTSGVNFSSFIGLGDTYNVGNEPQVSQIFSKIGNSAFKSGMWENGVWNNGWRLDDSIKEFNDIDLSIKSFSDIRWRFRITGSTSSVSSFSVGDEITIGNIIAIDINEKRRFIKDKFRIIGLNSTGINSRIGFIIVELETTFPIRRIERDSKKHKIKITKNGWLSGAFLNGYFTGVWNFGLFKGYPLITEMFNTNWIDGIFDGGHFQSEYYINGSFNDVFLKNNKLGLSFSTPHRLSLGDIIEIEMDDKTVNQSYNGETSVVEVVNDFGIVTNKDFGIKRNTSGGPINEVINTLAIEVDNYLSGGVFSGVEVYDVAIAISSTDFSIFSDMQNVFLSTDSYSFTAILTQTINKTNSNTRPYFSTLNNFNHFITFSIFEGANLVAPFTISGILPVSIQIIGNESGKFTTEIATSVIQNMEFNSNNISKTTSIDSLDTEDVFTYNSWIDVNYSNQSAVNIGRPQTKINVASRKSFSENNLFGYPTDDVLSSDSKFRDSYTLTVRDYRLGNKWKMFNDYVGESSKFTEYFGTSSQDTQLFIDQGWTFSNYQTSPTQQGGSITFSRTNDEGIRDISGEELKVESERLGGVLDLGLPVFNINNRNIERIQKDRYTVAQFDLVTYSVIKKQEAPSSKNYIDTNKFFTKAYEPFIHFNNINSTVREVSIFGNVSKTSVSAEYFPISKNIEHLETKKKRKIEFFFNKQNLSMNFTGGGVSNLSKSDYILNNLKIFEVDMIPFFQYFIDININKSIQIPFQGIAPYIDYESSDFSFIDSINIGLDSISVESTNVLFTGVGQGVVSGGVGTNIPLPGRPTNNIFNPIPPGGFTPAAVSPINTGPVAPSNPVSPVSTGGGNTFFENNNNLNTR